MMTAPSGVGEMNESCFSAVTPVIGWNQWQKCVAPRSVAQSFMALARISANEASRGRPSRMVTCRAL